MWSGASLSLLPLSGSEEGWKAFGILHVYLSTSRTLNPTLRLRVDACPTWCVCVCDLLCAIAWIKLDFLDLCFDD